MTTKLEASPEADASRKELHESQAQRFGEALVLNEDGTINVCIITPGWGNSGYYAEDMLKNAVQLFSQGLHMYWDHPTVSEEFQRPERSLRDLAGVLAQNARWEEGFAGAGIYSSAKVFSPYMESLAEMAPHIGISVVVYGLAHRGEIDGTTGEIIDQILAARSADFVTLPARGGKIEAKFESLKEAHRIKEFRESLQGTSTGEEDRVVDEATAKALQEENATLKQQLADITKERDELKTSNERQAESLALNLAKDLVADELKDIKGMPEITKQRLTKNLSQRPILTDGKLDEAKMKEAVADAVKAEAEYLGQLGFSGKVKDNGPSGDGNDQTSQEDAKESLKKSFESLGLRDDKLSVAIEGR